MSAKKYSRGLISRKSKGCGFESVQGNKVKGVSKEIMLHPSTLIRLLIYL